MAQAGDQFLAIPMLLLVMPMWAMLHQLCPAGLAEGRACDYLRRHWLGNHRAGDLDDHRGRENFPESQGVLEDNALDQMELLRPETMASNSGPGLPAPVPSQLAFLAARLIPFTTGT